MGELEARHNCGLVVAHSLNDAYSMIKALQHRGREAAGIAGIGSNSIDVIKWLGPVSKFDLIDLEEILPSTRYHTFLAHVRYATTGRKDKILQDAHPQTLGGELIDKGSHVIVRSCSMAAVHNGQIGSEHYNSLDKKNLASGCDTEAILHMMQEGGLNEFGFLQKVIGSYTVAIADKNRSEVVVMRDRLGMMPGVLGKKNGKFVVASEDIAFRKERVDFEEYLEPGSIYYIHADGERSKKRVFSRIQKLAHCMFQHNYIASVESVLDGVSVLSVRQRLGEALASEFKPDVDFVTYLPRCPKVAANAYAEKRSIPFIKVFYKMRAERSFQGTNAVQRAGSIKKNLYLIPGIENIIREKRILLIDDSAVRGNNATHAVSLLKSTGIKEVILANYTPKIGIIGSDFAPRGCEFGVDMPSSSNDFIARSRTDSEINSIIGAQTYFLSLDGMLAAFETSGISRKNLCYFCVGGTHPFLKAGSGKP